jgi:hypothetical protein
MNACLLLGGRRRGAWRAGNGSSLISSSFFFPALISLFFPSKELLTMPSRIDTADKKI